MSGAQWMRHMPTTELWGRRFRLPTPENLPAIFGLATHYKWGRRFRLPTPHVLPKKTPALASGRFRRDVSVYHVAFGGLSPSDPDATRVISRPSLCGSGPRSRQSIFRTSLVARFPRRKRCRGCPPARRKRKTVLRTACLGYHAESRARVAAAENSVAGDHAMAEGLHSSACQSDSGPNRGGFLAR